MSAYGLELYNEDLRDLALAGGRDDGAKGWDGKGGNASALKLQERPTGKDGRVVPEVRCHARSMGTCPVARPGWTQQCMTYYR